MTNRHQPTTRPETARPRRGLAISLLAALGVLGLGCTPEEEPEEEIHPQVEVPEASREAAHAYAEAIQAFLPPARRGGALTLWPSM